MAVETHSGFTGVNSSRIPTSKAGISRELSSNLNHTLPRNDSSDSDEDKNFDEEMDVFGEGEFDSAGGMLSPTISRYQSKLASVKTPAHEKEAAIREGDGYFTIALSGANALALVEESPELSASDRSSPPSPLSENEPKGKSDMNLSGNDKMCFGEKANVDRSQMTHKDFAPGSLVPTIEKEQEKAKDAGDEQIRSKTYDTDKKDDTTIATDQQAEAQRIADILQRPSLSSHHRQTEDSIMSYNNSLSRASSLGDDERFENIRKMANNRSKAFWDSMPSPNFRFQLPTLPSFSKVLNARSTHSGSVSEEPKHVSQKGVDASSNNAGISSTVSVYPSFSKAVDLLEGDLVVLGGYRGSGLKHKKKPNDKLWPPSLKCMADLATIDVSVGFEPDSEDKEAEEIEGDGMITNFGPIDVSRRLFKRLRSSTNAKSGKLRIHDYSYDWRLSPQRLAEDFLRFVERLECNSDKTPIPHRGATVIAHSLGGLLTRYAVNKKPHLFSGVLYAGTPQKAINILGPFKFNDSVMRNMRILTAQTNFSVRTSFALLPIDGKCFVDAETKEELPVDFFNPEDWIKYRLSPCIDPPLPPGNPPAPSKSILGTITGTIPLIGRKASSAIKDSESNSSSSGSPPRKDSPPPHSHGPSAVEKTSAMAPQLDTRERSSSNVLKPNYLPITISRDKAIEYLTRTLAEVKDFKVALEHRSEFTAANAYPPFSVLYGKSEPTVRACKVRGYESIACMDVYSDENLLFGSGDGVVLSKAAMLPEGYKAAKGGVVVTSRGHVTLLADVEAVGKALLAMIRAKKHGVGEGARRAWDNPEIHEEAKASGTL